MALTLSTVRSEIGVLKKISKNDGDAPLRGHACLRIQVLETPRPTNEISCDYGACRYCIFGTQSLPSFESLFTWSDKSCPAISAEGSAKHFPVVRKHHFPEAGVSDDLPK